VWGEAGLLSIVAVVAGGCATTGGRPPAKNARAAPAVALLPLDAVGMKAADVARVERAVASALARRGVRVVAGAAVTREVPRLAACTAAGKASRDACAARVGRTLGVARVVVGAVGRLGNALYLRLRAIDPATAAVQRKVEKTLLGDRARVEREIRAVARRLLPKPRRAPPPARVVARPWYRRWWVWTAIGAAVAVGAAGVALPLALTRDQPYVEIPLP